MARGTYFVGQGGHAWQGGMHGGGTCMGNMHVLEVVCGRGCAWLGWGTGMAGVGACVAREGERGGGVHGWGEGCMAERACMAWGHRGCLGTTPVRFTSGR